MKPGPKKQPPKPCTVEGCNNNLVARGMCMKHYTRIRLGKSADRPYDMQVCSIEGCTRGYKARGYCNTHYQRWKTTGTASSGKPIRKNNPTEWGPWRTRTDGYRYRTRGTYGSTFETQLEHRVVIEDILGRSLIKGENVHHINGDRTNNSPSNLELWNTSQPAGQRVEDKVTWAKELLALYEPKALASGQML